jgi:DeoR/GlpR family transcriptional regulator of sugar metabolism
VDRLTKRERHERILHRLGSDVAVRISALAAEFQVTTETIRRDLDELAHRGLISRTYGGAAPRPLTGEPGVELRARTHMEERRRIAAAAVRLVEPGDVLMIDAGSTTTAFAVALSRLPLQATVITNSLGVARALGTSETIHVILCPGDFRLTEEGVFGAETLAFLDRFHADAVFFGAGGFSAEEVTDADPAGAAIKRKMIDRAERAFLLADRSKAGQRQFAVVCPAAALDRLLLDGPLPEAEAAALAAAGVEVLWPEDLVPRAA